METITAGMTGTQFINALNNIAKVYNVKDYGAVGNGSTDDTIAIQTAINTAFTAGGGVVFIPRGVYVIGGALQTNVGGINYKSQLYIPNANYNNNTRTSVKILGESVPNFTQFSGNLAAADCIAPMTGSVLRSTLESSTAYSYVIASKGASGNFTSGINYNTCLIENIQILVNPDSSSRVTLGGIGFNDAGDALITNVTVTPYNLCLVNSGVPINNAVGIAFPRILGQASNIGNMCVVGGFESGFLTGDHTLLNDCISYCCKYGINIGANYNGLLISKFLAIHCINSIYVSGVAYFKIEDLETEFYVPGKWYDSVYTVLDTNNYGHGEIHHQTTEYNVGFSPIRFIKSGGANIQCYPIAFAAASSFTVTGKRSDATALTNLLTTLAAKGIIIDSTTAS